MKKSKSKKSAVTKYIPRSEHVLNSTVFLQALDRAIEFHRTNTNDPHNIGNAVVASLSEVRDAFKAYMV